MTTTALSKRQRAKELQELLDEVVDLEQCKALREDIEVANITLASKQKLLRSLALVELCITVSDYEE